MRERESQENENEEEVVIEQHTVATQTIMQNAETSIEKENAIIEVLLKFKRDELVGLCRAHKLTVSGIKMELSKRLMRMN